MAMSSLWRAIPDDIEFFTTIPADRGFFIKYIDDNVREPAYSYLAFFKWANGEVARVQMGGAMMSEAQKYDGHVVEAMREYPLSKESFLELLAEHRKVYKDYDRHVKANLLVLSQAEPAMKGRFLKAQQSLYQAVFTKEDRRDRAEAGVTEPVFDMRTRQTYERAKDKKKMKKNASHKRRNAARILNSGEQQDAGMTTVENDDGEGLGVDGDGEQGEHDGMGGAAYTLPLRFESDRPVQLPSTPERDGSAENMEIE